MNKKRLKQAILGGIWAAFIYVFFLRMFGPSNSSIGFITGLICFTLLNLDLTFNLSSELLSLIGLSLFLGCTSFLSQFNPYIGAVLNFFTVFIVSFVYVRDNKSLISYMYLMLYVFMLVNPVTYVELGTRFLALFSGVLFIFIPQLLFNFKKFHRTIDNSVHEIITLMNEEIDLVLSHQPIKKNQAVIKVKIRPILLSIQKKYATKVRYDTKIRYYFHLIIVLERLNAIIFYSSQCEHELKTAYLNELKQTLLKISILTQNYTIEDLNEIVLMLDHFKSYESDVNFIEEGNKAIRLFLEYFYQNKEAQVSKAFSRLNVKEQVLYYIKINFSQAMLRKSTLRISYSTKIALAVSVGMLVVTLFNIPYGNWFVLTIYVLLQPYVDETRVKIKQRLKGTLIGVSGFVILAWFLPYEIPKLIFLTVLLSIYFYVTKYDQKVILLSILSLSVAHDVPSISFITLHRTILVFTGAIVAYYMAKYIFPYHADSYLLELETKYDYLIQLLKKEVNRMKQGKHNHHQVTKLALYAAIVENELLTQALNTENDSLIEASYKRSSELTTLRFDILDYRKTHLYTIV